MTTQATVYGHPPLSADSRKKSSRPSKRRFSTSSKEERTGSSDSRSEEPTSELQALMRIPYGVFCLQQHNCRHAPPSLKHTPPHHSSPTPPPPPPHHRPPP